MSSPALSVDRYAFWEVVEERAQLTPHRRYLTDDRGRTLTFAEYRDLAERCAAGLQQLGVAPGQIVSWQLPTTLESAVLIAALSRLKVSANPIIPILRRSEVGLILEQLDSDWLFIPGVWRGFDYRVMADEVTHGRRTRVEVLDASDLGPGQWGLPLGDPAGLPAWTDATADTAVRWYYYSSGTTGRPKGAIHTERSAMMAARYQADVVGIGPDDALPIAYPITHIGGPLVMVGFIRIGAEVILIETFEPEASTLKMAELGATTLGSAVPFFQAYLAVQQNHPDRPLFPRLRFGLAGGAPLPPEIHHRFAREMPCAGILNAWGLTEFPAASTVAPGDPLFAFEGTVGRPCIDVQCHAFDEAHRMLPPGTEGELRLKGHQCFRGYVDAELDAHAFDPDGWFRTGDLGYVDVHGFIRITGRIKDIIIRNAENISAVEVEDVLYQHPAIASVAVIGVPDPIKGEAVCAVVVLAEEHDSLTIADLIAHCRAAGLANQKIPEQLEFIDAIPVNSMGKVLKHELRARYQ